MVGVQIKSHWVLPVPSAIGRERNDSCPCHGLSPDDHAVCTAFFAFSFVRFGAVSESVQPLTVATGAVLGFSGKRLTAVVAMSTLKV